MKEKELKRMSRRELVEIIYAMKKRELELTAQLEHAKSQLNDKVITVENAGSLADAALALSGIFKSAQDAADIYVASVKAKIEKEGE